jgi:hypothetical protein
LQKIDQTLNFTKKTIDRSIEYEYNDLEKGMVITILFTVYENYPIIQKIFSAAPGSFNNEERRYGKDCTLN